MVFIGNDNAFLLAFPSRKSKHQVGKLQLYQVLPAYCYDEVNLHLTASATS